MCYYKNNQLFHNMHINEHFAEACGMIMAGSGFLINIFGFPYDVYRIYKNKRVKGHTTPLLWFNVLFTLSSIPYYLYKQVYILLVPESIGAISCIILFVQVFKYEIFNSKKKKPSM